MADKKQDFENIVRIAETNINGTLTVRRAIKNVKGISFQLANAISNATGLGDKKISELSDDEKKTLEAAITNPEKHNIPIWMLNRRKSEDGTNKHLSVSQLDFTTNNDINKMKKLKTYRGIRHSAGLPTRGQRTRGSFRKGKAVGVKRKGVVQGGEGKKKE